MSSIDIRYAAMTVYETPQARQLIPDTWRQKDACVRLDDHTSIYSPTPNTVVVTRWLDGPSIHQMKPRPSEVLPQVTAGARRRNFTPIYAEVKTRGPVSQLPTLDYVQDHPPTPQPDLGSYFSGTCESIERKTRKSPRVLGKLYETSKNLAHKVQESFSGGGPSAPAVRTREYV